MRLPESRKISTGEMQERILANLNLDLSRAEIERFSAYARAHASSNEAMFRRMNDEYMRAKSLGDERGSASAANTHSGYIDQSKSVQNTYNLFSGNSLSLVAKVVLRGLHLKLPESFADFWMGYRAGLTTVAAALIVIVFIRLI